jgi:hypothetical protein
VAVLLELGHEPLRLVDRDREPDADVAAALAEDRGVDADDLTVLVEQRTAGVARVDGASVWMKSSYGPPMLRPFALTIPAVTVLSSPNGFPIASTQSPTSSWSELPSSTTARSFFDSMRSTARSVFGSRPTTVAGSSRPSLSATVISFAFSTTWLLVSTRPSFRMMKPDPVPSRRDSPRGGVGKRKPRKGKSSGKPKLGGLHDRNHLDVHDGRRDVLHEGREGARSACGRSATGSADAAGGASTLAGAAGAAGAADREAAHAEPAGERDGERVARESGHLRIPLLSWNLDAEDGDAT